MEGASRGRTRVRAEANASARIESLVQHRSWASAAETDSRRCAPQMPAIVLNGSYIAQSSTISNAVILGTSVTAAKLASHARQLIDCAVT